MAVISASSLVKLLSDECHCTLLMISQHWSRYWLGAVMKQTVTWASYVLNLCRHIASLCSNGSMCNPLLYIFSWSKVPPFKVIHLFQIFSDGYRNASWPSDAIWRQWSWTTLAQVMACCLTAPSHYLNQCWLIIRGVLWHTSESSFAGIAQGIDSGYEFEKDILKNIFKSPRGQWVNASWPSATIWR